MTTKSISQPVIKHLRNLLPVAQNVENETRRLVENLDKLGPAADTAALDLTRFIESQAELLLRISALTAENKELAEQLHVSISNKVSNVIMIAENLDLLAEVDHILAARRFILIRDAETMRATIEQLDQIGEEGRERLRWMAEGLKRNGY